MKILRILGIGAHPDDLEVGAAGLFQRATDRHVLIATRGERGGPPEVREREAQAAISRVGGVGAVLRHPDTALRAADFAADIENAILQFRPNVILTLSPRDFHQDHSAASAATMIACRNWSGTVLAYCTPSAAEHFAPNWFVGLTAVEMASKIELVKCHASQQKRPYLAPEYIEAAGRYWAQVTRSACQFVEPYEMLRHREH